MSRHSPTGRSAGDRVRDEETRQFFCPCPRGLEGALAEELSALGAGSLRPSGGGVGWDGPFAAIYRVNLWSRIASRVLCEVGRGPYRDAEDIYRLALALPWSSWFDCSRTLRVDVTASRSPLKSLDFALLRIKDAVCDHFIDIEGRRPSIDTHHPDVRIAAFADAREIVLYLDTSGEPLFKRGYRRARREAPLKENLAAGLIALSGWDPRSEALLDPMCGSGTIAVEAALLATDTAPGLARRFAFESLHAFDPGAWAGERERARARRKRTAAVALRASDRDANAVRELRETIEQLELADVLSAEVADVGSVSAPAPQGVWLTNPPYGMRVGDPGELAQMYKAIGAVLKQRFAGWRCYFLAADMKLPGLLGLRESRRTPLHNGAIECRLFEFRMVAGRMTP